jgi:uncharacterized membrane protein YfcA|tara:strand:+ start:167 stop:928 length:762 start_codon:yes stop_codon:yes gene_type:complete
MTETIILIIAAFVTSMISAVIGMGGGVTLLGIMAIIIPEGYLVVAYHGIIQLVSNVTRATIYRDYIARPIFSHFLVGVIPGLIIAAIMIYGLMQYYGVSSASQIKIDYLKPLIGIYILWFLYLRNKNKKAPEKAFIWMGGLSGLVTVFIGAAGPLIAPFFITKDLTKENVIATKAACQALGHLGKMPIFIYLFGVNYFQELTILLPLIIAVYFGTHIGKKLLGQLPENTFIILFKVALTLIAIRLILNVYLYL